MIPSRRAAGALLSMSLAALAALAACAREPAPASAGPSPESVTSTKATTTAAPTVSATTSATAAPSTSALPPMDDACKSDGDCTLYMEPRGDDPCCPACTGYKGASKSSLERHRTACAGRYGMCAGSCAAPATHAECRAGHCAAVADKP